MNVTSVAPDDRRDCLGLLFDRFGRRSRHGTATEVVDAGAAMPPLPRGANAGGRGGGHAGDQTRIDIVNTAPERPGELLRFVLDDVSPSAAARAECAFLAAIEPGCAASVVTWVEIVPPSAGSPDSAVRPPQGGSTCGWWLYRRAAGQSSGGRRGATGPAVDPEAHGQRLADGLLSAGAHTLMGKV